MNFVQLILLGLQTIAEIAVNPALGLDEDGAQVASLVGLFSGLVNRGAAAAPELEQFVNELRELNASGQPIADSPLWEAIVEKRKTDLEALKALRDD